MTAEPLPMRAIEQAEQVAPLEKDAAFHALVERCQKKAFWMALDILGSNAEAEDLSQEAFIRAYERWDDFRGEAARDTWFFRILINLCLSARRRRGVWKRISDWLEKQPPEEAMMSSSATAQDPTELLSLMESREAIEAALEELSPKQRTAFVLRYLHDLSIQEVAEITESAAGTVKSHLFRALQTVRKHLTEQGLGQQGAKS